MGDAVKLENPGIEAMYFLSPISNGAHVPDVAGFLKSKEAKV
jgi:hypothetical protein